MHQCELYSKGSDIGKWQRCGCAHYYVAQKKWVENKKPFKQIFLYGAFRSTLPDTIKRKIPNDQIFPFGGLACFGNYRELFRYRGQYCAISCFIARLVFDPVYQYPCAF
jgi:hypothetical protein